MRRAGRVAPDRPFAIPKHTCGGPVFGTKTPGCPRCDELLAGAPPVAQAWRAKRTCGTCGRPDDSRCRTCYRCQIRAHDCHASHCGAVCTAFDW